MFGVIRNIIQGGKSGREVESPQEKEQKKHVAAGVLLLEAAYADNECSADELEQVIATLKMKFSLSDSCVDDLLALVRTGREQAVDLWQFTSYINHNFSREEKLAVMEDVWRIILLDGKLDKYEDYYAHRLADLLHLTPEQMISAKLAARDQLAELK